MTSKTEICHSLNINTVIQMLYTDIETGLSSSEMHKKWQQYGLNELDGASDTKWHILLSHQLKHAINYIFLAVTILSFVQKDCILGSLVLAITLLNSFLEVHQMYQVEQTMKVLHSMASPTTSVIRDGKELIIIGRELVPGGILLIQEGDAIAANILLFDGSNFEVDEALLSGESENVGRRLGVPCKETILPIGDSCNIAYSSTIICKGRTNGIVIATGMNTEVGKIAKTITQASTMVKLAYRRGRAYWIPQYLDLMALFLLLSAVIAAIIVMGINKFNITYDVRMYAMTAGLCAVPARITTMLTVIFVLGGKEMIEKKAIVRKLNSLETLGGVTNICSDNVYFLCVTLAIKPLSSLKKTDTLTEARMFWSNSYEATTQ
ncbi:calcium ATPase [Basidiobolus meristosporus CBS 931.73]|uniref:Calcium ATPase n=1 Tax=Basidiobolus meristosporus CBS 931.73 TaxID=1314790 RepID=A0A1Y1YZS5_9FUNG|nr:calcium ATPase [Basidiobolus meristosporus CBS 931.73]|eukprot:ORY03542.1 calcium ATPase [Basidiobolus meristosporus CBS 931.73]